MLASAAKLANPAPGDSLHGRTQPRAAVSPPGLFAPSVRGCPFRLEG